MKNRLFATSAITLALCALAACSHAASSTDSSGTSGSSDASAAAASVGGDWAANGATACQKYLTPDVVAAIWVQPAGHIKPGANDSSCIYQSDNSGRSITIWLTKEGADSYNGGYKFLVKPVPLANVGDKASLTANGIVAYKGDDRTCHIDAMGEDASLKVSRAALGQMFGGICNKLFALP